MSSRWTTAALATAIVGGVIGIVISGGFAPQHPAQEDANTEPNTTPSVTAAQGVQPAAQANNNLPVLPAKAATPTASASSVSLWDAASLQEVENQGITQHLTQVDPQLLNSLSVGQQLSLALPGRINPASTTLSETHNTAGTSVWRGSMDDSEIETITVVKGKIETHMMIATMDGTLSIIIDNATGKTVITEQNQLVLSANTDDHRHHNYKEHSPLPLPNKE